MARGIGHGFRTGYHGQKALETTMEIQIEKRVARLERELAQVKRSIAGAVRASRSPWWEQILGSFSADPVFDEAMRLGSQYRRSLARKRGSTRSGRR